MRNAFAARPVGGALLCLLALSAHGVSAQLVRTYPQSPLPAGHAGSFDDAYAEPGRLLNALEYLDATLLGRLAAGAPASSRLEQTLLALMTGDLRDNPPALRVGAWQVEPRWARVAPEIVAMLDWTAMLRRQIYDAGADEALSDEQRGAAIAELLAYYKTRPDLALSSVPKDFELTDGQYFSLAFRESFPRSNGLSWAARWLEVGMNEALMAQGAAERSARVEAVVQRFWEMLEDAPDNLPRLMPMTSAVAPEFAGRYPEVGIILDNASMLRTVVADILASPEIPGGLKRDEALRMAALFRSDTAGVIPLDAWLAMGPMIGAENMGGITGTARGSIPLPTVPRGLSLAPTSFPAPGAASSTPSVDQAAMAGMDHGAMAPSGAGSAVPDMGHGDMPMPAGDAPTGTPGSQMDMPQMMAMHERMMADPVIRERVASDPVLVRMMDSMMQGMGRLEGMGGMQGMGSVQGMADMPGMQAGTPAAAPASAAESARALDFIILLLSDSLVEERLRADPALRELWADPQVQRRIEELRGNR